MKIEFNSTEIEEMLVRHVKNLFASETLTEMKDLEFKASAPYGDHFVGITEKEKPESVENE